MYRGTDCYVISFTDDKGGFNNTINNNNNNSN